MKGWISYFWISGFLISGFLIGCEHDEAPERDSRDLCYGDGNCEAEVHSGKHVGIVNHFGVDYVGFTEDDNLVFEYRFEYHDHPQYIDDERTEFLFFQVDAGTGSFDYATLPTGTVYYKKSCGECITADQEVRQGTLKGPGYQTRNGA